MNISIKDIRLPRTIVIAGLTAGIAAFGIISCASSGPPQISDQNRELCFQHAAGTPYAAHASQARDYAKRAEQLAASGSSIPAGEAVDRARQIADEASDNVDVIRDDWRAGELDADDIRRSARACRDIAQDYAKYAERVAKQ